jgi:hypothetical protein
MATTALLIMIISAIIELVLASPLSHTIGQDLRQVCNTSGSVSASGYAISLVPTQFPHSSPQQPQWGIEEISTLLFGCVALVLGILTLILTYWLGRRHSGLSGRDGMSSGRALMNPF